VIPNQVKEPPTRIPPKASRNAASLWALSVWERFQLAVNPTPEVAATLFRAAVESFDARDLRYYVENEMDVIPLLREWLQLDNGMVHQLAPTIVRIWWQQIFAVGMNPRALLEEIRRDHPDLAAILDTPSGTRWYNATIFNLITYFRAYGQIQGDGIIQPPPNLPERLRRRALKGAAGVVEKVRGRQ
jgi:hypothetical protein